MRKKHYRFGNRNISQKLTVRKRLTPLRPATKCPSFALLPERENIETGAPSSCGINRAEKEERGKDNCKRRFQLSQSMLTHKYQQSFNKNMHEFPNKANNKGNISTKLSHLHLLYGRCKSKFPVEAV